MLIQNICAINDVVTIKLISGEEIVGKLIDKTVDSITLAKPVHINLQPVGPKQVGIAFMPVLGSVQDANIQIALSAMSIRPVRTGEDVKNNYLHATTGIIPVSGSELGIIS
jgi:hypothetical protein